MKWLLLLLLVPSVFAECMEPADGMVINTSVSLCGDTFDVPSGITVTGNGIVMDCNGAILRGTAQESDVGVRVEHADNVTVRECIVITFDQGLLLKNVTNSLVVDNSFLKNRIGIRMIDAFENVVRDNNDKSHEVPVSAVNSMFNVVMLGNRKVSREFCEVNACNEVREMDVCVSGDFYCSDKCTGETDEDCRPIVVEDVVGPQKSVDELVAEAQEKAERSVAKGEVVAVGAVERAIPWPIKILIYSVLYLIAFVIVRAKKR